MSFGEHTTNDESLLLLTGAIVQLIITSTAFCQDQQYKHEQELLTYHRTQQITMLNQLYEVVKSRKTSLFVYGFRVPAAAVDKELETLEAWLKELLIELFNLIDAEKLPMRSEISTLEQLRDKMILTSVIPCEPPTSDLSTSTIEEAAIEAPMEMTKTREVNTILHWTKNKSKSTHVTPKKKTKKVDNTLKVQIGSQLYKGSI